MTHLKLHIREAREEDTEQIVRFQMAMALETEGLKLAPDTVKNGVEAVFEDPARGRYLLAEIPTGIIASLLITTEWSDWRNGMVFWIHSVYVLPEYRRQGVFKMLYKNVHDMVRSAPDIFGIRLYVHAENNNAISVYHNLGMDGTRYKLFEWLKNT